MSIYDIQIRFFLQVTAELFNILSGQSDVDHPLCEVCWLHFSALIMFCRN